MFGLARRKDTTTTPEKTAEVTYVPAVDITEGEAGYTIFADVPGADKDSVSVTYNDGVLEIKAESKVKAAEENLVHQEFRYANYERSFRVKADVDPEKISAEYANGVLQITLPRKTVSKKIIPVTTK
ncbi:MAG: Hsp20/alpha crystallin family protein [Turneriella sp.]|nr:Hsp20/alpha crystallin family protein [Turneriella sp.]